jgi:hypothetical protein
MKTCPNNERRIRLRNRRREATMVDKKQQQPTNAAERGNNSHIGGETNEKTLY